MIDEEIIKRAADLINAYGEKYRQSGGPLLVELGAKSYEKRGLEREMTNDERTAFMAGAYHVYSLVLHHDPNKIIALIMQLGLELAPWSQGLQEKYPRMFKREL